MFDRLKRAFGRRKSSAVAAASVNSAVVPEPSPAETLAAEEAVITALASAAELPSQRIEAEANETLDKIAALLANEPPKLKRGSPGGQEYVVRLTYNQKEWIESTYPSYAKEHGFAPFQRVVQAFVEKYMQSVEEIVNTAQSETPVYTESAGQEA
ncbi:MAG: hypothetical protein KIY12_00890 [Thermoplasmata archaeon]|uniref:Uncharacterized protein n=1 Tax=Candidatus Sysuiplasma superficiale TaxID=2823368 RepID=A0A8J7YKQ0_9ARCH|nr:hypothetical protein [Candidatus Sysuiplasma superficiale]MBX8643278.1 hypothetical protein [Candidatus Sysuiplasma superficiale]MCL4347315.1 hypothetical protein [Candidatus Thermoplasmatota archaeon]